MEETQKPCACTVEGCAMRFIDEDHLTVHKKKHDMVLNMNIDMNFGSGQKTNIFVADQTPTPTRFIRNCEEVGLFQDLQNVNPFEETFRKAVEARVGGSHLEVPSLHMTATTDDTLHTPHVFPNIPEEHNTLSNLIPSTPVETDRPEKSPTQIHREELDPLEVPNVLHSSEEVVEVSNGTTTDLDSGIKISTLRNVQVEVIKQEADTSQQIPSHASSCNPGSKIPVTTASANESVQVVIRMLDGQLVQLSGVSIGSLPSTQLPIQATPSVQQTAPTAPTVISDIQLVQNPPQGGQDSVGGQSNIANVSSSGIHVTSTSSSTGTSPQARLSAAKMKLKQRIQFNFKQKSNSEPEPTSTVQKKTSSRTLRTPSSDGSDTYVPSTSHGKRSSNASDDVDEQRLRFRERNRAAAMRCREKRKHWVIELEKRADETQRTNQQLTTEIAKLRSELVQVKTLLLAHKDCSVTKAMQRGIEIVGESPCTRKMSPAVQLHVKTTRAAAVTTLSVALQGSVNVSHSPEEPSPKVVLLSKPPGLKRRRQAAAALTVSRSSDTRSKDTQLLAADPKFTVAQPITVATDPSQVSSSPLQQEVVEVEADNSNSTTQTCVITLAAPAIISGVPIQHVPIQSLKPTSVTSTSYFIPPKVCPQSTDNLPQVIKLNPNVLKADVLQTNIVTHASGDSSMDSGNGSDIEVLADIPSKTDSKS